MREALFCLPTHRRWAARWCFDIKHPLVSFELDLDHMAYLFAPNNGGHMTR